MQLLKSRKGVMGTLVTAGIGIVVLAVVAVLGITMLTNMGNSIGGVANTSAVYAAGYIGSSSGGLLTYLPVIIPAIAVIGILTMLFGIWKFGGNTPGY